MGLFDDHSTSSKQVHYSFDISYYIVLVYWFLFIGSTRKISNNKLPDQVLSSFHN